MQFYKTLFILIFSVSPLIIIGQEQNVKSNTKDYHLHLNDDVRVSITLPTVFAKAKIADKNDVATFVQSSKPTDAAHIKSISIKATEVKPNTKASENYIDGYLEKHIEGAQYTIENEGKMQDRNGYFVRFNYTMGSNKLEGVVYFFNKEDNMLRVFFSIANGAYDEVKNKIAAIRQSIQFKVE